MCNRYAHKIPRSDWKAFFDVEPPPELPGKVFERYNVAPTQEVPAIVRRKRGKEFAMLVWGFALHADSFGIHFNARSETANQANTFSHAFTAQRCLLPASGFYEWEPTGAKPQPWYFHAADGTPLALGAIWNSSGGRETVAILTTAANKTVRRLHERMPVLLRSEHFDRWLEARPLSQEDLLTYCVPAPEDYLVARAVSLLLNNSRNEGAELHKPPSLMQRELF